ncbi:glycoside hydrolase family 66 protein, partial [Victivallis sp.]
MKLIYAIALLSCTLTLSAEWGIRLNVYGEGKVELAPAPGETYVHNIQWGEEKARKYSLYVQKKGFPDEGETTFSFSFLPKQSGRVILELSGCFIQRPKMKEPDKAYVHYLSVRADGCTIRNGDFRERNAAGDAVGWSFFGGATTLPQGVEAWQRGGIRQQIAVKGDEVVTVTIVARKGRYEKAVPPPQAKVFRHGKWELTVDGGNGAWLQLKYDGEILLHNPARQNGFSLHTARPLGEFRLTKAEFSPEKGTLALHLETPGWRFVEQTTFGKWLVRSFSAENTGKKPVKFTCAHFFHYVKREGRYLLPGTLFGDNRGYGTMARDPDFTPHRAGKLEEMKNGEFRNGVFDCYFAFLEQRPERTLVLAFDGRKEASRTGYRALGDSARIETYLSAAGWAEPGVPQQIGDIYLAIHPGPLADALQTSTGMWFRDVGMLPPANRPDWVFDRSLYVTLPTPNLGSVDGCRDGDALLRRIRNLHFNSIWLLPPYYANGMYSPTDYYRFRADVGTFAEYREFLKKAHANRFRVWQDIVPHGGQPATAKARGISPWSLIVEQNGKIRRGEAYDYSSREWQKYILAVCDYYMKNFDIDGFRIDQCGSSYPNWRAPHHFAKKQPGVDPDWLREHLEKNGGKVPPISTPRASTTSRITGAELTGKIRDIVRKYRPDGAVLAETWQLNCAPAGDVIFDFTFRRIPLQLARFGAEITAKETARYQQEKMLLTPPGTIIERFIEVHDGFPTHATGIVGQNAGRAFRS